MTYAQIYEKVLLIVEKKRNVSRNWYNEWKFIRGKF